MSRVLGTFVDWKAAHADFPDTIHGQDRSQMIDFWGDAGVNTVGYLSPYVEHWIIDALKDGLPLHVPAIYGHPMVERAAEMLCVYSHMDGVFFTLAGGNAMEAAIRTARRHFFDRGQARKRDIVSFHGQYHGRVGMSLAATDRSGYREYMARGFGLSGDGFFTVDSGPSGFAPAIDGIDFDKVAAIVLAPYLFHHRASAYSCDFWKNLLRIRRNHGCLIILDEIQTGMGRMEAPFAYMHPDIQRATPSGAWWPDILVAGKGMAAGFPMAATLFSGAELMDTFSYNVYHTTMGGGSPFGARLLCEHINLLLNPETTARISAVGAVIRAWAEEQEWIADAVGAGIHWGLNLKSPIVAEIAKRARSGNVFIFPYNEQMIRLCPSAFINTRALAAALGVISRAAREAASAVASDATQQKHF